MPERYYLDRLYPFQDEVLKAIEKAGTDFYLTGGTALSRCYLNHRYSEDLDFFVNDNPKFKEQSNRIVTLLRKSDWECSVSATTDTFIRILLEKEDLTLKIDFVNDIPFRYGDSIKTKIFHKVDNWRNILSNKLCAISRLEAKDIADILFISKHFEFSWEEPMTDAREKDLWAEPIEVCKIIDTFNPESLKTLKWVSDVNINELSGLIKILHHDIFYGSDNTLKEK